VLHSLRILSLLTYLCCLFDTEGRCINNIVTNVIPGLKRSLNMADSSFNFTEVEQYEFKHERWVYEMMEVEYARVAAEDRVDGIGIRESRPPV
jgi:hypothetical protein